MDPYRVWTSLEPQIDKDQVREGGVILIAQLLGLLLTFIGEAMTSRLVTSESSPTLSVHSEERYTHRF